MPAHFTQSSVTLSYIYDIFYSFKALSRWLIFDYHHELVSRVTFYNVGLDSLERIDVCIQHYDKSQLHQSDKKTQSNSERKLKIEVFRMQLQSIDAARRSSVLEILFLVLSTKVFQQPKKSDDSI